jgi:putative nucleotidyltransferase with HDIG domain
MGRILSTEQMWPLFDMVEATDGVPQSEKWHPEGDVLQHTLQVMEFAFRESSDLDLVLAALVHDVGKTATNRTDGEKVTAYAHEWVGGRMVEPFVSVKTLFLVEQHMRVHTWINGQMRKVGKVKAIGDHPWLPCMVTLARWDAGGREKKPPMVWDRFETMERLEEVARSHFGPMWAK